MHICTNAFKRWAAALALTAAASGTMAQDISVVQIAPFSLPAIHEPAEVREGIEACLEQTNRNGGVRGHKIVLTALDDQLSGPVFMTRFHEAMAKHPLAMLVPVGSAELGALFASKALDTSDIVVIGAIPGAEAFRQPGHAKLFHIRAGDKAQLERILIHSKTLGIQRVHVLYQDVAIGQSGLAVLQAAAKQMGGLTISSTVSANNPAALRDAAHQAGAAAAQVYVVLGFPQFMADALAQLRDAGVNQSVFALGYLSPVLAAKAAGLKGVRGLGLPQVIPNPNGRSLPIQRDFQTAMQQSPVHAKQYTSFQLEGCIAARVLVEGLRRVNGTPTPSALAKSLHTMGEIDLGGFHIHFGEGQIGSTWTDIGIVSESGKLMF